MAALVLRFLHLVTPYPVSFVLLTAWDISCMSMPPRSISPMFVDSLSSWRASPQRRIGPVPPYACPRISFGQSPQWIPIRVFSFLSHSSLILLYSFFISVILSVSFIPTSNQSSSNLCRVSLPSCFGWPVSRAVLSLEGKSLLSRALMTFSAPQNIS